MLDVLRKHASTWLIKLILGSIVVVFVFYFGTSSFRGSAQKPQQEVVATVNGDPITRLTLNGYVQKVKDQNPDLYKNIPEPLLKQFESSILGGIVEERIVSAAAQKLGVSVSDEEVANTIRKNAAGKDGTFNEIEYREKFRPWHLNHYGFDFESWIKSALLIDKVKKNFADATLVSDAMLKNYFEMGHTRIKLKKIEINPFALAADFKPSEEAVRVALDEEKKNLPKEKDMNEEQLKLIVEGKLKNQEAEKRTNELAIQLWPLYSTGKSVADQLKTHKLSETETPFVSLLDIDTLFDGASDAEAASQLFGLSKNNPYPPAPMKVNNRMYLFKLVDKEAPNLEEFEKNKATEMQKYKEKLGQAAYESWYQEKAKAAKIEIKNKEM